MNADVDDPNRLDLHFRAALEAARQALAAGARPDKPVRVTLDPAYSAAILEFCRVAEDSVHEPQRRMKRHQRRNRVTLTPTRAVHWLLSESLGITEVEQQKRDRLSLRIRAVRRPAPDGR